MAEQGWTQERPLGGYDEDFVLKHNRDQYDRGQATFEVRAEKTGLLVIDMLDEFVKPEYSPFWVPDATKQVPKIKELIEACRDNEVPVIYTAYLFHPQGIDVPRGAEHIPIYQVDLALLGQIFTKESVYEEIAPQDDDMVILKPTYDAFVGTKLDLVLKNMGIETIIICGTMTNYCCGSTARSGFMQGYNVVFGEDVNSSDVPELHEAEIKTLRRGFAMILTADEIIERIRGANR